MNSDGSQESMLSAIRAAGFKPIAEAPASRVGRRRASKPGTKAAVKKFITMLEAVGGEVRILENAERAADTINAIVTEDDNGAILLSGDAELEKLKIADIIENAGRELLKHGEYTMDQAASAGIGITSAEAGIADTGTVVLRHTAEKGRLAALLPPTHIALLEQSNIYPDKSAYLKYCRDNGIDLTATPITWVTGPSLTADIEKVLVRGAHGPKRLIALIIQSLTVEDIQ